jgi:hypothetical protein
MPELERFLTDKGGLGAFGALLILKVGEMIWHYFQSRDASLQSLQCALEKNTVTLVAIQGDLKKYKVDINRAFTILKKVSGDKWPEYIRDFDDLDSH